MDAEFAFCACIRGVRPMRYTALRHSLPRSTAPHRFRWSLEQRFTHAMRVEGFALVETASE